MPPDMTVVSDLFVKTEKLSNTSNETPDCNFFDVDCRFVFTLRMTANLQSKLAAVTATLKSMSTVTSYWYMAF